MKQSSEVKDQAYIRNHTQFANDLKLLFKSGVLISNIFPVLAGFWLALHFNGLSLLNHWGIFLLTIMGSTLVMGGALVINNWYDVDIDSVMERTKKRPTVTGSIPLKYILIMGISFSVLGMILLLITSIEAAIYAFVGWFTYVILYTMWSKRRYTLNTIIGSISGAVTPLIGWAAIDSATNSIPVLMFFILFIWQVPHTFAIAIRKYDDYKRAKVAVLPVVHGLSITKRVTTVYVASLIPLPFFMVELGWTFILIATGLNVIWLIISITGFTVKDHMKWARTMFLYSVNYIMIIFLLMIGVTFL
ncbi:heme o synthase [Bacillaceae bacterium S4-13-58]